MEGMVPERLVTVYGRVNVRIRMRESLNSWKRDGVPVFYDGPFLLFLATGIYYENKGEGG